MTPYIVIFLASFLTALALTPLARQLSFRWGVVAIPGGRRKHQGPMPKLGGVPLLGAFLVGVALTYWLLPPQNPDDAFRLRGVVLGAVVVFVGGLLDDVWDLPPRTQFVIQGVAAAIAIYHLIFIEVFTNPLTREQVWISPRPLALLLTLFWVAGMMNTINWLDGLDGLAAGVSTIAALLFAWHSYNLGQTTVALFPLALAGALLGFLPFNFAPARIFLGSAGPFFLGYTLATLAILAPAKIATALLVMAVPIMDVAWQIFDRMRRGNSPFKGDRGHLHFRLSDGGLPTRPIVLTYYTIALAFGLVAIFASGWFKLLMFMGLATVVLIILVWLSYRQPMG
jgi:UDP-GlcNAc:undecaprenyl-phosphate GlcNAc-1-phosphate transferase